ncbi:MAG: hypothetical protein GF329_07855 [Candidatus Lokiarchaeota archaeon]|nr:hypothetical protein [Candidatus Lokiarchaeota archaeon]
MEHELVSKIKDIMKGLEQKQIEGILSNIINKIIPRDRKKSFKVSEIFRDRGCSPITSI